MTTLQTFFYFAYGSNLLAERILLLNPTAVRRGIGKLDDYRLDFNRFSERWGGCSATIAPQPGKHVWGAIWEIDRSQMPNLDDQEGVRDNIYVPLQVNVTTPESKVLECRVYKMPEEIESYETPEQLPENRRPSRVYLETILQGSVQSKLPDDYFKFLRKFPHNDFSGPVNIDGFHIDFIYT
ncbi:hypothetical protein RUM44_005103 [Polyplax serrata]|uniref:gamma-glutamylcyclotransferase n=1 Tax=Polyplax serrata TaxID=468196 RepID=A0ABR1AE28_POLSC